MALSTNDALITAIHCITLITALLSSYTQYKNYNPNSNYWNWMNAMTVVALLLTLNSTIPQYFLFGRTEAECHFLHNWTGTFHQVTHLMVKEYFLARSNMVAQGRFGKVLMVLLACISITTAIYYSATLETMVIPGTGFCAYIPNKIFMLLSLFIVPVLIDITINSRFVYHVFLSSIKTAGCAKGGHMDAPMRLLRIICLMSVSSAIVSLSATLFAVGVIPLPEMSLLTPIFVFEQSYHVWSACWPPIMVRILKSSKSFMSKISTGSKRQTSVVPKALKNAADGGTQL